MKYANNLGLNILQLLQDLAKRIHVDRVNQDIKSGLRSGVVAALALFINGIRYIDYWNVEQLITAIINTAN